MSPLQYLALRLNNLKMETQTETKKNQMNE